jgi:hypothetical protein
MVWEEWSNTGAMGARSWLDGELVMVQDLRGTKQATFPNNRSQFGRVTARMYFPLLAGSERRRATPLFNGQPQSHKPGSANT